MQLPVMIHWNAKIILLFAQNYLKASEHEYVVQITKEQQVSSLKSVF